MCVVGVKKKHSDLPEMKCQWIDQETSSPSGAASTTEANAKLEKAVMSMLAGDEQVRRASLGVRADVTKNQVTLSGNVDSAAVRAKAVELAKTAHAGVIVNDKMTTKPRGENNARSEWLNLDPLGNEQPFSYLLNVTRNAF